MPTYTVFPIKSPIIPSHLAAYKTLRLTSLQIDPQAFLSTHAREVDFPEEVWEEWLDSRFKQTFVASVSLDAAGDEDKNAEATSEWIGAASIVGPSAMPESLLVPFKEAGVGANWEMYGLFAMWVHPAHRRNGVGVRMIKACLEWTRTHVDPKLSSEHGGELEKVVVLLVCDDNLAGRALYSRTGFTDLEGVSWGEGERWMLARV